MIYTCYTKCIIQIAIHFAEPWTHSSITILRLIQLIWRLHYARQKHNKNTTHWIFYQCLERMLDIPAVQGIGQLYTFTSKDIRVSKHIRIQLAGSITRNGNNAYIMEDTNDGPQDTQLQLPAMLFNSTIADILLRPQKWNKQTRHINRNSQRTQNATTSCYRSSLTTTRKFSSWYPRTKNTKPLQMYAACIKQPSHKTLHANSTLKIMQHKISMHKINMYMQHG